jgi:recombination protein RecA
MRSAISKASIESQLAGRFGEDVFKVHERGYVDVISTGDQQIDALVGGFPRGAITEIYGSESSGRTSLMLTALAYATTHDEVCALVDTSDVLDPASADNAALDLERMLWIRCASNLEHSFKAVDLLLQGGGFGLVVLDLGDIQAREARRIISSWWYRFKRVVENTPTALVVIAQDSCARSCASLTLALKSKESIWSTGKVRAQPVMHGNILRSNSIEIERLKPIQVGPSKAQFIA